jgi:hypothetical protein
MVPAPERFVLGGARAAASVRPGQIRVSQCATCCDDKLVCRRRRPRGPLE